LLIIKHNPSLAFAQFSVFPKIELEKTAIKQEAKGIAILAAISEPK
jgi:hypothetical protein